MNFMHKHNLIVFTNDNAPSMYVAVFAFDFI